jgi:hypothetical protein
MKRRREGDIAKIKVNNLRLLTGFLGDLFRFIY